MPGNRCSMKCRHQLFFGGGRGVPSSARRRAALVGIGCDQACIHGEALATDETGQHACRQDTLEYAAEDVAVAKAFVAGPLEGRVVGNAILDAQAAEPAISEVHLNFAAQRTLGPYRENVAEDEHPNEQDGIYRRAARNRVVGRQLLAHPGEIQHAVDLAHQMVGRNDLVEVERIEELPLARVAPPHHRPSPSMITLMRRNHASRPTSTEFCNKIRQEQTSPHS